MSSTQPGQNPPKRPKSRAKTRLPQIPEWPPVLDQDTPDWLRRLAGYKSKLTNDETLLTWAKRAAWATGETRYDALTVLVVALIRHGQRLLEGELELDFVEAFTLDQVEQTISVTYGALSRQTRGIMVPALRRIGRALNPFGGYTGKSDAVIGRTPSPRPYTGKEQDEILRKAQALRSPRRRKEVTATFCVTAGAGATVREINKLTWSDITVTPNQTLVNIGGRAIPVLSRYATVLAKLATESDLSAPVVVGTNPQRVSAMSDYAKGHGIPNWSVNRATVTWRVFQLERVPLPLMLRGSGLSATGLDRLMKWMAPAEGGFELLADEAN